MTIWFLAISIMLSLIGLPAFAPSWFFEISNKMTLLTGAGNPYMMFSSKLPRIQYSAFFVIDGKRMKWKSMIPTAFHGQFQKALRLNRFDPSQLQTDKIKMLLKELKTQEGAKTIGLEVIQYQLPDSGIVVWRDEI